MITAMSSDQARQTLDRLLGEIDAFGRCGARLSREQLEHVTALRIRRNLLVGLLMVRAIERTKKIVSLARWRWGFASRTTMLRYGLGHHDAARGGAPGVATPGPWLAPRPRPHRPADEAARDGSHDRFEPEAG